MDMKFYHYDVKNQCSFELQFLFSSFFCECHELWYSKEMAINE
jgi:hypothetical protein